MPKGIPLPQSRQVRRAWAGLCLAHLLAPGVAAAQLAGGQRTGEALLFGEIPSVIGASRFEQRVTEAPASVTIITAEEIERQGWRTLGEVLRNVRGFFTTYDHAYTYVGVRGFGQPGDYNTRVLLLIDGERVNENIYHGAYVGTESPVELELVDRIEIIRGPSSSLYGTNAFFGVINVLSKRGRDLRGATAAAEIATYGSTTVRAGWGDRFASGLEALISAARYRSDGRTLYFPEFDDPATHHGVTAVDRDRRDTWHARLGLGDFALDATGTDRTKQIPTAAWETSFGDPRFRLRDAAAHVRLGYENTFENNSALALSAAWHRYDYEGSYPYDDVLNRDWGYGRWWTAEARWVRPAGHHKLVVGSFTQINTRQEQGYGTDGEDPEFVSDSSETVWAVFAQDEVRLGSLLLNAGVRYDHYTGFGGTTNPRAALVRVADDGTVARLLYGRAFRAPNQYERFYEDGGLTQKPAPDLEPETISTTELVLERPLGSRLRASASAYRYDVESLIVLAVDPADSLLVYDNLGSVTATGVELEVEARLGRTDLDLSWSFQRSRDDDSGERPANSPSHLAQLGATAPLAGEALRLGLAVRAMSSRIAPNGGTAPAWAVADLNLLGRDLDRGLRISAGLYNVFDAAWYDVGGEEHVQRLLRQDGRNFRLALSWSF
jgi:iron complex outermembrane receptor protein